MMNFGPAPLNDNKRFDKLRAGVFIVALLLIIAGVATKFFALSSVDLVLGEITNVYPKFAPTAISRGGDVILPPPLPPVPRPEKRIDAAPAPASLTAQGVIVKDFESGTVLFSKDEYSIRPLASLTKLMSALVLLDTKPDWSTTTPAAVDSAFDTFVLADKPYVLLDLWRASLVGSSNRALLSLVDASPLTRADFVIRMNDKARELGLTATTFVEPTGLDPSNVSSASDVALLLAEALRHEEIVTALNLTEYTIHPAGSTKNSVHMWNTNWLLLRWVPHSLTELIGGKTGYIPASGYNFTAEIGDNAGHLLSVVVLGAASNESRFAEARDLAEWVFANFEWK